MSPKYQNYAQRLELLHRLDRATLAGESFETIAQLALSLVQQLIPFKRATILLCDFATREATVVAALIDGPSKYGWQARRSLNLFEYIDELCTGRVRYVEDISAQPNLSPLEQLLLKENIQAYCSVPLIAQNELFGTLNLGGQDVGSFTPEHIEIAREVADQLAVALKQTRLREQLQQHAADLEQQVARQMAELAQERNFVSTVLDTIGALVIVVDRQARVVQFNRACEQLTGYTLDEVKGKPFWNLLLPEETEPVKATFEQLRQGHYPNTHENHWITQDGQRRLIAWSNTVLLDSEGNVEYIIGTGIDITERTEAEERLVYQANLLQNVSDAIIATDLELRITNWNKAAEKIYGWQRDEVIGQNIDTVCKSEFLTQTQKEAQKQLIEEGGWCGKLRQKRKNGESIFVMASVSLLKDSSGNPIGGVTVNHDITESQRMEESLKTQGRALENMAEGVLVADEDNIIYLTNSAFDAMFGYERGELSGQNASVLNLDPARTAALFATEINVALQTKGHWSGEFNNRKKDGSPFITAARISRLEMPNKTFLVSVQEDITERKRMELEKTQLFEKVNEQRKQLRALTQLLAEAEEAERKQLAQELHDQVGSNLTALGLNLNILQKQIPDSLPDAKSIQARLKDAQQITEQTTERIRNAMANLHPPVLDDYGLVTALRWYGKQLAPRVTFAITILGEEPDPRLSTSTEYALFRITQEALTNVAKHAQADEVTINVGTDGKIVRLVIADDGRGFDAAQIIDTVDRPGWGLLTMVERAERLGGRCRIESHPKEGTRIIVEMPR